MYGSPDVLSALRSSRRYEQRAEQTHRARAERQTSAERRVERAAFPIGQPDYGCVDWFVYDEERHEKRA